MLLMRADRPGVYVSHCFSVLGTVSDSANNSGKDVGLAGVRGHSNLPLIMPRITLNTRSADPSAPRSRALRLQQSGRRPRIPTN